MPVLPNRGFQLSTLCVIIQKATTELHICAISETMGRKGVWQSISVSLSMLLARTCDLVEADRRGYRRIQALHLRRDRDACQHCATLTGQMG